MGEINSVDVKKIMEEIRTEIKERGETKEVLSFDEFIKTQISDIDIDVDIDFEASKLHYYVSSADQCHTVNYYQMIPKGGVKSFVKRSVRKTITPTVKPICDAQNEFNENIVQALQQIEAYIVEKDNELAQMKHTVKQLTERIEALERDPKDPKEQ